MQLNTFKKHTFSRLNLAFLSSENTKKCQFPESNGHNWTNLELSWPPWGQSGGKLGPGEPQQGPQDPQQVHSGSQMGSKWSQQDAKRDQAETHLSPRWAQDEPKELQDGPSGGQTGPQRVQKWSSKATKEQKVTFWNLLKFIKKNKLFWAWGPAKWHKMERQVDMLDAKEVQMSQEGPCLRILSSM